MASFLLAWVVVLFSGYNPRVFGHGPDGTLTVSHHVATAWLYVASVTLLVLARWTRAGVVWSVLSAAYAILFVLDQSDTYDTPYQVFVLVAYGLYAQMTATVLLLAPRGNA